MSEIPTKDSEKGKLYFCKQSEEGEWHLLGEATKIESIDDDTVGMDMSGCGFSLDAKTLEFVVEATFPKQLAFELMGLNVVNIVYCKDCMHRNDPLKCPYYKFDATDDHDFCSRGEKMARTYMTVRELIEKLLDCRMSARVTLFTPDPERPDCRGVGFDINEVVFSGGEAEIRFTDWRDEVDERKARVNEN